MIAMRADLSPRGRASNLRRMASETFDVVVVGGGVVGAGVAREAASRGLRTALVERGDFASGTSGKTSRLVHGGLRYLKTLKVGLVRQAIRERDLFLQRAPALVRPLAFTIPAYRGRGMGTASIRLGLFLYDLLSRDKVLPRRAWLAPRGVQEGEPRLDGRGLRGGGRYHDALTDDARFVLAVIRAAAEAGAVVANHAEATGIRREGDRVVGVTVGDRLGAEAPFLLHASAVVNAIGVWLRDPYDRGVPTKPVRPTKGIHVFLPRERVGNREAVVVSAKRDGRMMFVLPWGRLTLVGTTDTDYDGPLERVVPDADDVGYLLESVNEAFPGARITPADVVSAYAGLRPLIGGRPDQKESDISREHEILEGADGVLAVVGGKLTTHRAMAEEVVDRLCRRRGNPAMPKAAMAPLGPPEDATRSFRELGFEVSLADHLGSRHDPTAFMGWMQEPQALEAVVPGLPYVWAEVDEAVEGEMAMTLGDVLVRRLGLFYESDDQGVSIARSVAERMARRLSWDASRIRQEILAYEKLVADHRGFRNSHGR